MTAAQRKSAEADEHQQTGSRLRNRIGRLVAAVVARSELEHISSPVITRVLSHRVGGGESRAVGGEKLRERTVLTLDHHRIPARLPAPGSASALSSERASNRATPPKSLMKKLHD